MDSISAYRKILVEVIDFAFGFGTKSVGIEQFRKGPPDTWEKSIKDKFYISCHEGFKKAQLSLLKEISKYQNLQRETTKQLKEFRRQRDKKGSRESEEQLGIINQRLHTFSHIADGIAWQLIGGQIHIARRFHIGQHSTNNLDSSNIESAIKVAASINKKPEDFALISDLTSWVQIGDILARKDKSLQIYEVKEGKVNHEILDFFSEIGKTGGVIDEKVKTPKLDKNTIKQMGRMLRQQERAIRAADVINNDKGVDPRTGSDMVINTPDIHTETYHEDLSKMQIQLEKKIWSYNIVDTCLHIGMYRDKGLAMAGFTIEHLLKEQTENFIIIDLMSITRQVSEPIFVKPFPPKFIVDILSGKVKIILGLNMDALIETFNVFGLETRWMTRKETAKSKQYLGGEGVIVVKNRGISITFPSGQEMTLSGGVLSKILYDSIKPSNMAMTLLSTDDNIDKIKNGS